MSTDKEPLLSPSGRYRLTVTTKETRPGCWNYSVGTVTRVADGAEVISVERNYSSFPYEWVEGHPRGHDYLVCGADYQGQTVVELDTGRRRDLVPAEAVDGWGFCWAGYTYHRDAQLMLVEGCYWACPYEWRVYDFSDPMEAGWPQLAFPDDGYADDSARKPEVGSDGSITFYETRRCRGNDGDDDEEEEPYETVAWQRYRREGLRLVLEEQWVDPEEAARRAASKAAREKWDADWAQYKATDPLYLLMKTRSLAAGYAPGHVGVGTCYEGWCPHYTGNDGCVSARLADRRKVGDVAWTVDLEWGQREAPIKLTLHRDGRDGDTAWYPHSLAGMAEALTRVEELLGVANSPSG